MSTSSTINRIPFSARNAAVSQRGSASSGENSSGSGSSDHTKDARLSQTIELPDGRTLGYAEFGPVTGYPLFYFHGYPSSRLEAYGLSQIAYRQNVRIISPDRPGFGLSTFQPSRTLLSWPGDIDALANHLNLKEFAILGASGGGPYALACAYRLLPKERMSAVGLVASSGPWTGGTKDVPWFGKLLAFFANTTPGILEVFLDNVLKVVRWGMKTRIIQNMFEKAIEKERSDAKSQLSNSKTFAEEEEEVSVQERREEIFSTLVESFRQGSKGAVKEAQILSASWNIPFEELTYPNIHFWHGKKDVNAPIGLIRYLVGRLTNVGGQNDDSEKLVEFDEDDHFIIMRRLEDIVGQLVKGKKEQVL